MPTRIVFSGAESVLVREEVEDVIKSLENISPSASDLVELTRVAGHGDSGTVEGKRVFVRPSQVVYVTPA